MFDLKIEQIAKREEFVLGQGSDVRSKEKGGDVCACASLSLQSTCLTELIN